MKFDRDRRNLIVSSHASPLLWRADPRPESLAWYPRTKYAGTGIGLDGLTSYKLHANSFVSKPVDFDEFIAAIRSIEDFWLTIVRLPRTT